MKVTLSDEAFARGKQISAGLGNVVSLLAADLEQLAGGKVEFGLYVLKDGMIHYYSTEERLHFAVRLEAMFREWRYGKTLETPAHGWTTPVRVLKPARRNVAPLDRKVGRAK